MRRRGWFGESHRHYLASKGVSSKAMEVSEVLTLGLWRQGDRIKGGVADAVPRGVFDPSQVERGKSVELEHTSDPKLAEEIARDHLVEDPAYYDKLEIMERSSLEELQRCGKR